MVTPKNMRCNICGSESLPFAKGVILGKYSIQYYSCSNCGFIQTESPYWLEEAYLSPIAGSDIGLIGRNIKLASFMSALIPICYSRATSFLDYGGGNGMFVRMMRDRGFEFYWHDKYALNQFAKGFEVSQEMKFSLVTAFEVFEHLPRPLESIAEMFRYSDILIFSTRLLPSWNVTPNTWWYFSLDTGQHVSLYSKESLRLIAKEFNVKLSSNGISLHVFSSKTIPDICLKALSFPPFASVLSVLLNVGRRSLLEQDYYYLTGKPLT